MMHTLASEHADDDTTGCEDNAKVPPHAAADSHSAAATTTTPVRHSAPSSLADSPGGRNGCSTDSSADSSQAPVTVTAPFAAASATTNPSSSPRTAAPASTSSSGDGDGDGDDEDAWTDDLSAINDQATDEEFDDDDDVGDHDFDFDDDGKTACGSVAGGLGYGDPLCCTVDADDNEINDDDADEDDDGHSLLTAAADSPAASKQSSLERPRHQRQRSISFGDVQYITLTEEEEYDRSPEPVVRLTFRDFAELVAFRSQLARRNAAEIAAMNNAAASRRVSKVELSLPPLSASKQAQPPLSPLSAFPAHPEHSALHSEAEPLPPTIFCAPLDELSLARELVAKSDTRLSQ